MDSNVIQLVAVANSMFKGSKPLEGEDYMLLSDLIDAEALGKTVELPGFAKDLLHECWQFELSDTPIITGMK